MFLCSYVTHLVHFAAGLWPPVVPCVHIHTLCLSLEEKITTQASIIYHLTYIGASLSVPFQSLFSFHLDRSSTHYSVPHLSLFCLSHFSTFFTSHSYPSLLLFITFYSYTHSLPSKNVCTHITSMPLLSTIFIHFFSHLLLCYVHVNSCRT